MKSKKKAHLYGQKSEDYTEKESRELSEIRRDDRRSFLETAKETISHKGYITPMS